MTDSEIPQPTGPTFPGTVVPVGEQSSQAATLHLRADAVVAVTKDGAEHVLPYADLSLSLGGYERNYIYCNPASGSGPSITTSAPNFLATLDTVGGEAVAEALAAVASEQGRDNFWKRATWGCAGTLLIAVVVFAVFLPTLLGWALAAVPVEADVMLGEAAYEGMQEELGGPKVTDPRITGPIQEMVDRIGKEASVEGFEFKVDVIQSDTVNAFALPGGQMVVLTGLLEEAKSADEVAGVIGHEIAHVTLRHGLRRVAMSAGVAIVVTLLLGDVSGWVLLAGEAAAVVVNNSYSQDQESDADVEGARMLAAAGLDPEGLIGFFELLKELPGSEMPSGLSWLSTHPEHQERIDNLKARLPEFPRGKKKPLKGDWEALKKAVDEL